MLQRVTFPAPIESEILAELYAINLRRFFRLSLLMVVVHLIHVVLFLLNDVTDAGADVRTWRNGIIYSHSVLAVIAVVFASLCRPGRSPSHGEASLYSVLAVAIYLAFGVVVATIDQLVTPAITPFMLASIGIGVTILLPPWRSFTLYALATLSFSFLSEVTQSSPERLLSLRVNSVTMGFLGFGLNWALFSSKAHSIRDFHIIENQRFDLAAKNRFLRRLNEARDRFFAIIAHDLRGPIGSQAEALTVLNDEYEQMSERERRSLLESLQKSSRRSYELLDELLRWARSQTGRIPYRPELFALHALILETLDLVADRAGRKEISIHYDPDKEASVFADRSMIHSVLGNLLGNAIKFTPRHGTVRIEIERVTSMIRIDVIDSGEGIRPELLSGIFQEGEGSPGYGTEGEHGSGLGLIISRQFVERNKGEIGVQSTYGHGSRFFFTIPVSDPANMLPLTDDQRASRS